MDPCWKVAGMQIDTDMYVAKLVGLHATEEMQIKYPDIMGVRTLPPGNGYSSVAYELLKAVIRRSPTCRKGCTKSQPVL